VGADRPFFLAGASVSRAGGGVWRLAGELILASDEPPSTLAEQDDSSTECRRYMGAETLLRLPESSHGRREAEVTSVAESTAETVPVRIVVTRLPFHTASLRGFVTFADYFE
jgi:hypothetical protein